MKEIPEPSGQFVQSLARGLSIIRAFDADHQTLQLTEIAKRTDLSRATARRFLLTLEELGYVRNDGRQFSLTPAVLELGFSYLSGLGLPQIAQPHLEWLSQVTHESASVAVLDKNDVVYVARVTARKIMTVNIAVGTRFQAHTTSLGRAILAFSPEALRDNILETSEFIALTPKTIKDPASLKTELGRVRDQGWSMVDSELEYGVRSVSVPLFSPKGTVIGALNTSTTPGELSADETVTKFLPSLQEAAKKIEHDYALSSA
ncbi:MAG: IclR family transcriptional regulator C-terminal domain-containing protein [Microbacteriaceae bacterium]